jgi:hypothetical protein
MFTANAVNEIKLVNLRCKSGLVASELNSRSKGCGVESRLIQNTRWKWLSHAIIDSCTQFWFICGKNKKNLVSQMGQTDKKTFFF